MSIYLKGLSRPTLFSTHGQQPTEPCGQLFRLSKLLVGTVIGLPPNISDLQRSITVRHMVACELPSPPHPTHVVSARMRDQDIIIADSVSFTTQFLFVKLTLT